MTIISEEKAKNLSGASRKKVLVITGDPIGEKLAGPAIRSWNMAHYLSGKHDVTLLTMAGFSDITSEFRIESVAPFDNKRFTEFERWADVIIFQGQAMRVFRALRKSKKILVVDIYDPMHLEQLEQARNLDFEDWRGHVNDATRVLNQQLARGDFFLCASEKQKYFWLGQLAALGRINPHVYQDDPNLDHFLAIVPFGLSRTPPVHTRNALRGVVEGIHESDKILIWSGGLYNWFDPLTLISAVAALAERHPETKLFFQGTQHPHPDVPEMAIVSQSRALAQELGVLERNVFFNDSWVDFDDRQNYLLEANSGVTTHHDHIETTFSFRTRILDYLWAGLPIVTTAGDHFAELVDAETLGVAVEAENVPALTQAIERTLFDQNFIDECRENIARVREQYFWETALLPLMKFMDNPSHAPDWKIVQKNRGRSGPAQSELRMKIAKATRIISQEGFGAFISKFLKRFK